MRSKYYLIICMFLIFCKKQNDKHLSVTENYRDTITQNKSVNKQDSNPNFLDEKFRKNKISIPDDGNANLYPSYSYFDKSVGSFSVNFIGKSDKIQNFWSVYNKTGFFSKYNNPEDGATNSKEIEAAINQDDYYIIVSLLPSKFIKFTDSSENDFDITENAQTKFYLYENNKWVKIGENQSKQIPENNFKFYIKLIQQYYYKENKIPQKYQGNFSKEIETEATMDGMASITYNFSISENKILLENNTYQEPIRCEGIYYAKEENGILNIYYADKDLNCISIEPTFKIKVDKQKYFIKGVGGENSINNWIKI